MRTEQGGPVPAEAQGTDPVGKLMITLALDAPSVERVVYAAEYGRLWLSSEPKDAQESGIKVRTRADVEL